MSGSDTEVDVVDDGPEPSLSGKSGLGSGEPQISPEMLASLDKMTNITRQCARQLQAINEAMERSVCVAAHSQSWVDAVIIGIHNLARRLGNQIRGNTGSCE